MCSNILANQRVYTYDALGRPLTRQTSRNGQTVNDSFVHTYRSELASAQVNGQTYAYDYDNIGNRRMSIDASDYAFYDANELNQYSSIRKNEESAIVPTFDAAGNQTLVRTATGTWSVTYNAENRPVIFQKTTDSVTTRITCTYDYMGRRATKKVEEITTDGRWINRDPIAEQGGRNLYGFVGNKIIINTDFYGLFGPGTPYSIPSGNTVSDMKMWNVMKFYALNKLPFPIAYYIMSFADYTFFPHINPIKLDFSASYMAVKTISMGLNQAIHQNTRLPYYTWLENVIKKIVSKLPKNENIYNFGFLKEKITFLKYTHIYFSFGDARLDAYISLKIKRGFLFNCINAIIIYGITDYYTFAGYNNYGNKIHTNQQQLPID